MASMMDCAAETAARPMPELSSEGEATRCTAGLLFWRMR